MDQEHVRWIKSSYSGGSGTECVEVAASGTDVAVRDSKVPQGARLGLGSAAWTQFVAALRQEKLK
ncbi:uncharacterized protein DUF397 [Streptomyces sp. SLBN-118]|uniref:DUF397 domain-containing protein n=1 Tax=Streptomyces sp. SLBN-118 TaxID=2768454 RepID=UPI0011525863|nr:DUF397 domain-containing protein [Streptomyces sp. SLBN-118]TQK44813.1 uncharacterized protein DUF397 [Streptomyces sp. SLBN-118]